MIYADALERYMLELINEERSSRGLHEFQLEVNLNSAAEDHSQWILDTNTFSHTGVNGTTPTQRIIASGFDYSGARGTSENIAIQSSRGAEGFFDDVRDLHVSLMNSPGHRANLLSESREYIGIGIEVGSFMYSGSGTFHSVAVTQNFGRTQGSVDLDDLTGGIGTDGALIQGNGGANNLMGTANGDTLIGGGGADTFVGGDGDDLFIAGNPDVLSNVAGRDNFVGGAGIDAVSYEGSFGSLRVDLEHAQINTFAANGDTYDSIENVIGSQGADNIRGTAEDNNINGGRNVDYLFGRRGEDTLEGGVGDDVLFGGLGEDVLIGGENRDRAQYSNSQTAVELDLANSARNTGEAAGDTYLSIEDLAGGRFNDIISGDSGNNRLFGREANDRLDGRAGDDYLNGGSGQDTLIGGQGNDVLRGGASRDTFVFESGMDTVEDWFLDRIELDRGLWGGADLTAANIISTYGNVVGNDAVFNFGSGNVLTLEGQTDMTALETFIFDI